ncbi:3-ketoacyl-ACP reductase [Labrys wisconsinensis]|uniref:NAD(P)-dependent dehydrogenase (Short-subunit alcohol dehydrogenase family) n=1 Tax=Labrys wisconsinensis TaxID=425677 RepID=A0ABU0JKJ5_9HYPH|nr:3-ketoacyl-ACP reductase [Labrys wisconsinensis]MDQ0474799.1 NAD(P)-dependent dehydrogenase (short-subunit alcohol dehydrogenase family) [Labrys wisconsinensis]
MTRPVALVTGARRGIGRAIGLALAEAGHDIAFTDIVEDAAGLEAQAAFEAAGAAALFVRHDVAALDTHARLIDAVTARFGRLDCFVSNAGIGTPVRGDMLDLAPASFDTVLGVNLRGAAFLSQAAARAMLAAPGSGRTIVFVTSVSAELASPERADYCVSKAALAMWAKNLAVRLAADGIGVFEVRPGVIRTDMTAGVAARYDARLAGGLVPAMRWGEGDDVGRAVAGLASGAFGFATGSVIACDGGLSIARL